MAIKKPRRIQVGVINGRVSCSEPNLAQRPRTKMGNIIQGGSTDLADILEKNGVSTEDLNFAVSAHDSEEARRIREIRQQAKIHSFTNRAFSAGMGGARLIDYQAPLVSKAEMDEFKKNNPKIGAIMKTLRGIAEKSNITVELPSHPSERRDTNGHDHESSSEDYGSEGDGDGSEGE